MTKKKLLFYAIMIALQVAAVEIFLQAFYRISNGDYLFARVAPPIYEPDDIRVYRVKSNLEMEAKTNEFNVVYYTDNMGFRSDRPDKITHVEKADDTYRVVLLGPSFAFGVASNYEDIYATRIAEALTVPGRKIELINLGTPAQPPKYQLCWLEQVGRDFEPDLIIQTVYGNPMRLGSGCNIPDRPELVEDGYLVRPNTSFLARMFATAKSSGIVFYTWYLYQMVVAPEEIDAGLGTELYSGTEATDFQRQYILDIYNAYLDNAYAQVGSDVEIVFMYIPYSFVVRPSDAKRWAHLRENGGIDASAYRRAAKMVEDTLDDVFVPFINPTPALIERDAAERTYYFLNIHFTPAGNEVVADVSVPYIQRIIDRASR